MSLWRQLSYGLRGLLQRRKRQQDLADEVAQFYEDAEADLRERGLTPEEARRTVRRNTGDMAAARDHASEYGWENWIKILSDDLRFAARQLARHPVFTATAVLTLALGIGANTAIFTVVERVLLAPLPYNNAERLAFLKTYRSQIGRAIPRMTGPDVVDVREQMKSLEAVSLYHGGNMGVQLANHAAYTTVTMADANFARVFSLRPVAGRLYNDADAGHAALVSERFARDNFGTAQAAIGQVMGVEGDPAEIVGVLPAGFDYPNGAQVWLAAPLMPQSKSRTSFNYKAVALVRKGTSLAEAQSELDTLTARLQTAYPKDNHGKALKIVSLKESLTGESRSTLMLLWAAAGLILLIACVNVMHLELVRAIERQRELAIRRALGSSRWRVMQPVFLESILVALIGGTAGILLAFPLVRVLVAMAPKELPRASEIHLNPWVLGFAFALSVATAVISAILPAMKAAKVDPAEALKSDSSRGITRRNTGFMRDVLVIAEIAATFVLAIGAGLLLRTMMTLQTNDMGYQTRQMLVVDADAPATREIYAIDSSHVVGLFNQLFVNLRRLPGVEHVAGVMGLPTGNYGSNGYYDVQGGLPVDPEHPAWSNFTVASPGYFATIGIPLKRGRDFSSEDTHESAMVAIISESLARQSFGDSDPIGKQIRCGLDSDKWMTVVGVVGDIRQESPAEKPGPALYMPMTQHPFYANQIHIVLRTAVKPLSLMSAVEEQIVRTNPLIARRYTTLDALLDKSLAVERFRAALIASFAGIGLLLAMLGVYGTVAYSVAQRRFEFGVRMAFGAKREAIMQSVLGHAVRMASIGIVVGVVLSAALARLVESMLVGVRPTDPINLIVVAVLILITALGAALAPGWSATRVSPMVALRAE
ncbi:ABC transporter permease [Edaphobacter albus]|uniref:ABC transporter permease n=1 Tax=Edaphobacter sp. 4G125 TaxID=2763071 RepID=UPI0016456E16|nr:ABC transporter permease [Edaphobacter sp. 4G125]QNI36897.1 ABC transporter permease [Edaphobacter sp. 4G125]